jgi:hypothetical protein
MPSAFPPQWVVRLFGPPYDPALIDLDKYEGQLLVSKAHSRTLMPPPPIPAALATRGWTLAELETMRRNRKEAVVLYEWVAQLRITDPEGNARRRQSALRAKGWKERNE